jgi:hypothetical protein
MIITDLNVRKLDHAEARYPDAIEGKPFSEVYLMTATFDDGTQQECPCFVLNEIGEMTPHRAANILRFFAGAIDKMDQAKAA